MKHTFLLLSLCLGLATRAQNNFQYLDINNVKAGMGNRGSMHYNTAANQASYEVPAGSGIHSDLNAGLWIGAYDNANSLHLAAQTFGYGDDFWPGPLDTTNAAVTPATSNQYDKIWKLDQTDINAFITNFNNGHVQNGSYIPVADLLSWPAQGAGAQSRNLAPFVDVNHNHVYDPLVGGDYPIIKGDQSLYYIFNDNLTHSNTGGTPLKVEVHATAYAYGNSATASQYAFLNNATFYNYKIINRSNQSYNNAFVTLWTDVDLGYYGDDYIGCDVQGNYGYAYNGDAFDETVGSINGYGNMPPAAGYQVLKGAVNAGNGIDDDHDGITDEPCERMGMTQFNYFNNTFPGTPIQQTYPSTAPEFYRYMSGYWKDNTPFTCGGNGYGGGTTTPFVYPGTTYTYAACGTVDWSEITAGNTANDRRYMIGTGPFTIGAGGTYEIEYVHCTSFPTGAATAQAKLKSDMQLLKTFNDVYFPNTCMPVPVSLKEYDRAEVFSLYPNPATSEINLSFADKADAVIEVTDVYGKVLLSAVNEGRETVQLNISTLASGIYFVKVSSEGRSVVRKFIRQ
jgi:hypothetical protein